MSFELVTTQEISNFDLVMSYDTQKIYSGIDAPRLHGPVSGWTVLSNLDTAGQITVAGYALGSFLAVGQTLLSVQLRLANSNDTNVLLRMSGEYNDPPISISATNLLLSADNVVVSSPSTDPPLALNTLAAIKYTDTPSDDSFNTTFGQLIAVGAKSGQLSYLISGGTVSGNMSVKVGSYGSLTLNMDTGIYSYTPNDNAIEASKTTISETFPLSVTDDSGRQAHTNLIVTVIGVNDIPVISGTDVGNVSEDGSLHTSGRLTINDRDVGDAIFSAKLGITSTYGVFNIVANGDWNYTLNNSDINVQRLGAGQTVTDNITVSTIDGAKKNITINIVGTNDPPSGVISIEGNLAQGQTIKAVSSLIDLEGLGPLHYQWRTDGSSIEGATQSTLLLTEKMVGKAISVIATYMDASGVAESSASGLTSSIANVNDSPVGSITISGLSIIGQLLTATAKLTDLDGIGQLEYVWKANGVAIPGAAKNSLLLDAQQVGKNIAVTVNYTDGHGTREEVNSLSSAAVSIATFFGTAGNDTLVGSAANDIMFGAAGNDNLDGGNGVDAAMFSCKLADYKLTKSGDTFTVQAKSGTDGTDSLINVELLKFSDFSVNLEIQAKASAAPLDKVQRLMELYIAFFNRVPDADGLAYWIDQMQAGKSMNQIAEIFYTAGAQYSGLTGFSENMSNSTFISVIYRNVLGRTSGADSDGLAYWNNQLTSGNATRGSLVSSILDSAHTYKNHPIYGYVADLLDNKILVAQNFAINWGLSCNTADDSISQGMQIAAAVTPQSVDTALAVIGISAIDIFIG